MLKYHPDVRFLTDYTAGSLPPSQALCVAAHLHFCASCRTRVRELTELGTELFTQQSPLPVASDGFEKLLGKLDSTPTNLPDNRSRPATSEPNGSSGLPRAIRSLCKGNLDSLRWRNIGKTFRYADISVDSNNRQTSLFYIKAGGNVPHHRHHGDEITVVLKGSFSDQEDKYTLGDFIVRTEGEAHRPVASQDEDCLCLSTLDAPIVMTNWILRLLAPLFSGQVPAN